MDAKGPFAPLSASDVAKQLRPSIIAIDGPAASGKSTVGFRLARQIDYLYFDTGVMYRAVTWAAVSEEIDPDDGAKVGELAEGLMLDISPATAASADGMQSTVLVNGRDVSAEIRTPQVDRHVSAVSVHERVRRALSARQRNIGLEYGHGMREKSGVVMIGRDIGTVVLPEAPIKVYLEASAEERARRRYQELVDKGVSARFADVLADIVRRDAIDSGRSLSPLQVAQDATIIDTTDLTVDAVVQRILGILNSTVSAENGQSEARGGQPA